MSPDKNKPKTPLNVGPWRKITSKTVYDNPWISLTDHQVLTPSGQPGQYGVVQFKNRAVGVVPYEDGHIWLVGQTRFPLGRYSWEIPEGGCPEGEALEACAYRELQEETGISAKHLKPLFQMQLSNSVTNEWGIAYLATGLTQGAPSPDPTEDISIRRISLDEFYAEVERGDITDSLTVATCYKLMLMKDRGELD